MFKKILFIIVLVSLSVAFFKASGLAQNLNYHLCPSVIERIDIIKSNRSNSYSLAVKLNSISTTQFSEITKSNMGKKLAIFLGEEELIQPIIRAEIKSGIINLSGYTKAQATQLKLEIDPAMK